jgi:hypothetical protein
MSEKIDKSDSLFYCNCCEKKYSSYKSLWNHNKKFHSSKNNKNKPNVNIIKNNIIAEPVIKKYNCRHCSNIYSTKQSRWRHEKFCKKISTVTKDNVIATLENKITKLEEKLNKQKIITVDNKIEPINNQLINFIVDQAKTIENLKPKINIIEETIYTQKEILTLNLNNIIIVSRPEDNYINAKQLCLAGEKNFNDWLQLDTTKELINDSVELLHNDSWIHPDLAVQLAQWISPKFALQVSKWIRALYSNNNVSVDTKLLEEKEKEIQLKNQKIQLLEDIYVKKQKRKNYPENVIYIVTTAENKKNRIYIVGKAQVFKERLSTYNKTAEHEVVYYKQCDCSESLKATEYSVLKKLHKYREKANS